MQIDLIILTSCHPASNAGYQYILTVKDHFSTFVHDGRELRKDDVVIPDLELFLQQITQVDRATCRDGGIPARRHEATIQPRLN